MLSGVSIMCFTASYAVALSLELAAFFRRSGLSRAVMLGFAAAGLFAHTVYLGHRALDPVGAPLSSQQDWYLVSAWILVATYLYVACYHSRTVMGLLVLPLVLALIAAAAWLADAAPFAHEPAIQAWGLVHGVALLLATVAVFVGFLCGVMYLWQAFLLKRKLAPLGGFGLPSLEWLHRNTVRAISVSAPLMGVGVGAGIALNLIQQPHRLPLQEPLTLATLCAFAWLTIAGLLSSIYEPVRRGRRVALLTLVSFLVLALTLSVGLLAGTGHRYRQTLRKPVPVTAARAGKGCAGSAPIAIGTRNAGSFGLVGRSRPLSGCKGTGWTDEDSDVTWSPRLRNVSRHAIESFGMNSSPHVMGESARVRGRETLGSFRATTASPHPNSALSPAACERLLGQSTATHRT